MNTRKRRDVFVLLLLSFFSAFSMAQIFKYQDENGEWHFTDKDPNLAKGVEVINTNTAQATDEVEIGADLKAVLVEQYNPRTEIELATLAVVAIESPVIKGSGFFITPSGHIVTNKHVVRPAEGSSWKQAEADLRQQRESLENARKALARESGNMRRPGRPIDREKPNMRSYDQRTLVCPTLLDWKHGSKSSSTKTVIEDGRD